MSPRGACIKNLGPRPHPATMRRLVLALLCLSCGAQRPVTRPPDDEAFFCRYTRPSYRLPHGVLSLEANDPPVMTFDEKRARSTGIDVKLPWGAAGQPLRGAFTTGWVTYRMYLKPSRPLVVYPTEPVKLGVLELGTSAPLEFLGTDGDMMRVRSRQPEGFRSTHPLELTLQCPQTAISPGTRGYDDDDAPQPDGGAPTGLELVAGQDVSVSMTPGGAADGVLRLTDDSWARTATVLEERGDQVRVRLHVWPGRVTGWVARRHTSPVALSNVLGMGGLVGGLASPEGVGRPAWARCGTGVALYLVQNGELRAAGELAANAAYEVVSERPGWTEVRLPENAWLELQPGLSWAFKPGDLEVCRKKPAAR